MEESSLIDTSIGPQPPEKQSPLLVYLGEGTSTDGIRSHSIFVQRSYPGP